MTANGKLDRNALPDIDHPIDDGFYLYSPDHDHPVHDLGGGVGVHESNPPTVLRHANGELESHTTHIYEGNTALRPGTTTCTSIPCGSECDSVGIEFKRSQVFEGSEGSESRDKSRQQQQVGVGWSPSEPDGGYLVIARHICDVVEKVSVFLFTF